MLMRFMELCLYTRVMGGNHVLITFVPDLLGALQVRFSSPSARRWFKKLHGLIPRCPQFELLKSSRARDGTRPQLRAQESVAELASGEAASEATEGSTVLRCQGPAG